MNEIFKRIARFAHERPQQVAILDDGVALDYAELKREIEHTAANLYVNRIGLMIANSCSWAILDLATQKRGIACVPMPAFFSDGQLRHLIADAGLDVIITDQSSRVQNLLGILPEAEINVAGKMLSCFVAEQAQGHTLPPCTTKITYTSGTTGQPKGVCLTAEAMERVAMSLSAAIGPSDNDRALTLLPLSTLLTNIGGIYAPLYSGGTAFLPDLSECGIEGSTGVQADKLIAALHRYQPTVTILVPHLLKILVEAAALGTELPRSLRYIAVGGAPASSLLLRRARQLQIPVYQGYGLSEAASVVSVNTPEHDNIDSVGRPLAHVKVRIAEDGEIMVSDNLFSGYLGRPSGSGLEWATGDTGFLDSDGFLHITGRKKTSFATAHGRKLSPEWLESELAGNPAIAQAAVFGEGRNFNVAVIVPVHAAAAANIGPAIEAMNRSVPDYARVKRWIIADELFSVRNGLANAAGALHRKAIAERYAKQIEKLYEGEEPDVVL